MSYGEYMHSEMFVFADFIIELSLKVSESCFGIPEVEFRRLHVISESIREITSWEQRKLKELVKEIKRTDPNSSAPIMMITANDGFINQSERYSTDNAGKSLQKYILLRKGELAYNHGASKLRPYGSCFALLDEKNARIPYVYHCFSCGNENPEFLSLVLNSKAVERQLRKLVSSGARMDGLLNITFDDYTSVPVMMPSRSEQKQIANYIHTLNHLITLHQRWWKFPQQMRL